MTDSTKSAGMTDELRKFDEAVSAELPCVSTVAYNSHEICKWFAANVRERITKAASSSTVGPSDHQAAAARNAYFGAGRHGTIDFDKLVDDSKAKWRAVAAAVLALSASSPPPTGEPTWLMRQAEAAGFVTLEGYVHSLKSAINALSPPSPVAQQAEPAHMGDLIFALDRWKTAPSGDESSTTLSALEGVIVRLAATIATQQAEAILFEHEDGRLPKIAWEGRADFTNGEPKWHRVGPVDVSGLQAEVRGVSAGSEEWYAGRASGSVKWALYSRDFKHDPMLTIDGDFEDDIERAAYAALLAEKLNAAPRETATTQAPSEELRQRAKEIASMAQPAYFNRVRAAILALVARVQSTAAIEREKPHEGALVGEMIPVDQITNDRLRQSGETAPIVGGSGFGGTPQCDPGEITVSMTAAGMRVLLKTPEHHCHKFAAGVANSVYTAMNLAAPVQSTADGVQEVLLRQALEALSSATSFLSKNARDGLPQLIAAIRAHLSTADGERAPLGTIEIGSDGEFAVTIDRKERMRLKPNSGSLVYSISASPTPPQASPTDGGDA